MIITLLNITIYQTLQSYMSMINEGKNYRLTCKKRMIFVMDPDYSCKATTDSPVSLTPGWYEVGQVQI